jgi:octaprenyl-diphosphate synthase
MADSPSIDPIRAPITSDLAALDRLIACELDSNVPLIEKIIQYVIQCGGKRARPLLLLLCAHACGYTQDEPEHHELALVIEFIHTATLLHDDVVDNSDRRRGADTANAVWGNQASVLVGDFLYSRAFQILARRDNIPVMRVLADTTNLIAEGEMLQLANQHTADTSTDNYYRVIYAKTASLFAAASEIGARLAQPDNSELHQRMHTLGKELGMAFQIVDDMLDYVGDANVTGKNLGDDLQEGKITLPVIYAIEKSDNETAAELTKTLQAGNSDAFDSVLHAIQQTNAIEACEQTARQHIENGRNCLDDLPDSPYKTALLELLSFVLARVN